MRLRGFYAGLPIALFAFARAGCRAAVSSASPSPTWTPTATAASGTVRPTPSPTPLPPPTPTVTPATPSPTPTVRLQDALSPNDRAAFAGETYPDYAQVKPGEAFVKVWRLTNAGATSWGPDYFLHREAVQGAPLAETPLLPLSQSVPPGATVELAVPMTAPQETGIYSERWTLRNAQGQIVPVDGGRYIWVIIRACPQEGNCPEPPAPTGGQTQNAQDIALQLLQFTTTATEAQATVCIVNPPTPRHMPFAPVTLYLDDRAIPISGAIYVRPGCYTLTFPVTPAEVQAAQSVRLVIEQIRIPGGPPNANEACEQARGQLRARYPGLDFTCNFSMAGYYTNLKLPPGMSREQADRLIVDAIEGAVYGPWVFEIR